MAQENESVSEADAHIEGASRHPNHEKLALHEEVEALANGVAKRLLKR